MRDPKSLKENKTVVCIATCVREAFFALLMKPVDSLELDANLESLGLDYLVAVEINHWVNVFFNLQILLLTMLQDPSLFNLGEKIAELFYIQLSSI